ncbi:MAG TPA: copper chaperone PCu(A)C [Burkholderiaceae bacterium]|nr:copper chaperone PCu(A)C [Burkholderiaceae bacterium]
MIRLLFAVALLSIGSTALGQVQVKDAWARPALSGQGATGAFMSLSSTEDARVLGASSPVAGVVEIHEMTMDGNVMKMRAVPALDLPAGRTVELKPGGYHVMLMELKRPLAVGDRIQLDLRIETRDKRLVTQPVELIVSTRPAGTAADGAHKH